MSQNLNLGHGGGGRLGGRKETVESSWYGGMCRRKGWAQPAALGACRPQSVHEELLMFTGGDLRVSTLFEGGFLDPDPV